MYIYHCTWVNNQIHLGSLLRKGKAVWYGMSSRRIWMLKLILLLIWVGLDKPIQKCRGSNFRTPRPPSGGPLSISGPLGLNPRLSPQVLDGF